MSKYYLIKPEVAGGWGERTEFTRVAGKPVTVQKLDYCFDGMPENDLITTSPCFAVTQRLEEEIRRAKLSGAYFDELIISKSDFFDDYYGKSQELPVFLWMKLDGEAKKDDFALNAQLRLVVSARALATLNMFDMSNSSIEPICE